MRRDVDFTTRQNVLTAFDLSSKKSSKTPGALSGVKQGVASGAAARGIVILSASEESLHFVLWEREEMPRFFASALQ